MSSEYNNLISSDEKHKGAASALTINLTKDEEEASSSNMPSRNNGLHGVKQHQIKKNQKKRSRSTRSIVNLPRQCLECSYQFTRNDPPLSKRRSPDMCVGCFLLASHIRVTNEDSIDVKHWLCTGEITKDDWNNNIDIDNEKARIARRARGMKDRFKKVASGLKNNPSYKQGLPSCNDLIRLFVDQSFKCTITGWVCYFGKQCEKSWSVSFDHIVPVSDAPPGFNPWVSSNIQVTCNLLNKIKGNSSDAEVHRWFKIWKDANKHKYI